MPYARPVPVDDELLITVSFGRVLWLLEKAGATVPRPTQGIRPVIRCAENIVRWWLWEHRERLDGYCHIPWRDGYAPVPHVGRALARSTGVRGRLATRSGTSRGDVLGRFATGESMGNLTDDH